MLLIILGYLLTFHICLCSINNVCKTYEDYSTIHQNRNCWYNPKVDSDLEQIVKSNGYPFETYQLITPDGFILELIRIPHNGKNKASKRTPVILQHGLGADGRTWFVEDEAPALLFSNLGFDVWIPNIRGSKYSFKNYRFTANQKQYWDFSFHDVAVIDTPLIIEFIAEKTGQKGQIVYIGHSMGSTISYIYASVKSDHAKEYVRRIISLAPTSFLRNLNHLQKSFGLLFSPLLQILPNFGIYGIAEDTGLLSTAKTLCSTYPTILICTVSGSIALGINPNTIKPEHIPLHAQNVAGASIKTFLHYWQIILAHGRFQWFDYGVVKNLQIYNSTIPPEYDVAKIDVPVHLFYGKNDCWSLEEGVLYLFEKLKTEKTLTAVLQNEKIFNHVDFIAGGYTRKFYEMLSPYINGNFSSCKIKKMLV